MAPTLPIETAHLFQELNAHLLEMLRALSAEEWEQPTICSLWRVKDIAAHLLDTCLRRLSAQRDGYADPFAPNRFQSYAELLSYLHQLNAEWTTATRRLSPPVLIDWLEHAGGQLAALFAAADPQAPALFPVAWAGEAESHMWFDMAREYSERWHHQRQIVLAVGRETPIDTRRLYHPALETFLRALPHAYRNVGAQRGTRVAYEVTGPAGGRWEIERGANGWEPCSSRSAPVAARVIVPQCDAWLLLTKRSTSQEALTRFPEIQLEGDPALTVAALELVSIMA